MAYFIHGHASTENRQKIEMDILGPTAIKPRCLVYLPVCPERHVPVQIRLNKIKIRNMYLIFPNHNLSIQYTMNKYFQSLF